MNGNKLEKRVSYEANLNGDEIVRVIQSMGGVLDRMYSLPKTQTADLRPVASGYNATAAGSVREQQKAYVLA